MIYQLRLRAIEALEGGSYAVTFDGPDPQTGITVRCAVFNHAGINGVEIEPDVFMSGQAPARAVSAAVVAFDRARRIDE